jgi:hypothetical protein
MNPLNIEEVCTYVNENIDKFHNHRVLITSKITLKQLISKNPYLFRAKNITKASELIEGTLNAFLSSSEEKLFGDFLEDLAIFVASKTTGGHKSACEGMDLEFQNKGIYHVVSIKSGPNWAIRLSIPGWQQILAMQNEGSGNHPMSQMSKKYWVFVMEIPEPPQRKEVISRSLVRISGPLFQIIRISMLIS